MIVKKFSICLGLLILSGCISFEEQDSGPSHHVDVSGIRDAVPTDEPRSRAGNPESYVVLGKRYYVMPSSKGFKQRGRASWYGNKFHGNKTSNGEIYDMYAMSAAHKTLPIPTYVRVTNLDNNRSVIVRVNDRGPFAKGRIIDLSYVAAKKLDMIKSGTAPVEIEALDGSRPVQSSSSGAMIQVGAFTDRNSARKLAQSIANSLDLSVTINEVSSAGRTFYRVRIGPFASHSEIERWMKQLRKHSYRDAKVIPAGK